MTGKLVAVAVSAGLVLGSCRPAAEQSAVPGGEADTDTRSDNPGPAADIDASVAFDQLNGIEDHLPPPLTRAAPRFVGRWAAEEGLCARAAWRFSEDDLRTPAGSVCRFESVDAVPGGYSIAARCTAEGPEQADRLELRFAESADAMLFDSRNVAAAGLVRCRDEPEERPSPRRRPGSRGG